MGLRKNQNKLSADERTRYVNAVKEMKRFGDYDFYVRWHLEATGMNPGEPNVAHMGPAFFPWHRQFLISFEQDLQAADRRLGKDGSVTVPYWNWTYDYGRTGSDQRGHIWKDDFMGPNGRSSDHRVMTGPFATGVPAGNWILNVPDPDRATIDFLERDFETGAGSLPIKDQEDDALAIDFYDSAPWNRSSALLSFRNVAEGWARPDGAGGPGLHNRVHVWVGGSMLPMSSPNDPIFMLHHCNVDRIWAYWQLTHARRSDGTLTDQYPARGAAGVGHNFDDIMMPWDGRADPRAAGPGHSANMPTVRVRDVLNHRALGISYDADP